MGCGILNENDAQTLERNGYAIISDVLTDTEVSGCLFLLDSLQDHEAVRKRKGVYAVRNLLSLIPAFRDLAHSRKLLNIAETVLGPNVFAVRGILFDKPSDANWKVAWHQDLSIAVKCKMDAVGYGPWSEKAGVVHVQPPAQLLEKMLTLRIHLDDCNDDSGPLRVIPGSHSCGVMTVAQIHELSGRHAIDCIVPKGGVLAMRPLLLHASSPARSADHRRVIHLEYAAESLPFGLEWHELSAA